MTPREREAHIEAWQHSVAERLMHIHSAIDTLKKLYDERTNHRAPFDTMIGISATQSWSLDYRDRKYVFVFSAQTLSLGMGDLGNVNLPAGTWTNISFRPGTIITAVGQTGLVYIAIKQSDDGLPSTPISTKPSVPSALTAYSGNLAKTAAGAADTLFKFGSAGTTQFNHFTIQNNTGSSITYAVDQDSTAAASAIHVIANGVEVFVDRAGTVLHFNSAAQQNFQGTGGITVEAFA